RALVRSKLAALEGGRISVRDPFGEWSAGRDSGTSARIEVHDARAYVDILTGGSLGAAESYMASRWSADDLTALMRILLRETAVMDGMEGGLATVRNALAALRHRLRANTRAGSRRNIEAHYDLGNDLFALFLDETMTYSAGIFEHPGSTMREASLAKLDRICRTLGLGRDDHVLEIGTGWGSFAMHAAANYGCRVTTTTISREQHALAAERVREAGLEDRVELKLCDYRALTGRYDALVSIEMIEAVGHEFLPVYFAKCATLLADDGRMMLQAITMPEHRYRQYLMSSDFIRRYVFPGSSVPSLGAMLDAAGRASDLRLAELVDIGPHYATTLARWREAFRAREREVRALGYPTRFIRLWEYYLCYCEAGFAEGYLGDVQMLLEKPGRRR
ncbi:MAG: cyclopropane-fatty-acyl-phospholipid synthase family protein, partial [Gammaproteobacteria bacterium]|nr:cyclopropane-fatty-acyl-phospholipid synthase family protein [Gammaproteobacteria bacterium]